MIHGSPDIDARRGLRPSIWAHLAATVCVSMWGVSFVSSKVLLDNGLGAVEIYFYRFLLAYIILLLFCHKRLWSSSWRDEVLFALCGICSGSIYFIAENTALKYTLVTNVSLLTSLSPLITAMLAGLMYKNEKPGRGMLLGSVVAFIGVGFVIFNSSTTGDVKFNPFGDILSLGAAFSWAVYSLILRRLSANYDVWFVTRKTFFYGVVTSIPFLIAEPLNNPVSFIGNFEVIGNILFLAMGASLISYLLWSFSVGKLGAVKANNYMYFQSVITMIFSAIFLKEEITEWGVLGCALIIGGLYVGEKLTMRQRMRLGD